MRRIVLAAALPLALASSASTQARQVQTRSLTRPDLEFKQPFSRLVGIRELRDGRVIIADATEKYVQLVDLVGGTMTRIGQEGQGPGEYMLPMGLLPLPGDTTLINDIGGSKYVKIGPDGNIVGDVSLADTRGSGGMVVISMNLYGDAMGRLYNQGPPFSRGADGQMIPADSAAVTRLNLANRQTDTVGFMRVQRPEIRQSGGAGGNANVSVRIGGPSVPFESGPTWAVAPDGRVAVVYPEPYHVEWLTVGASKMVGSPIAYDRVRVDEAEKEAWREQQRNSSPTGISVTVENGQRSIGMGPTGSRGPVQEPDRWPEYKHPFAGGRAAQVAPTGELWVRKQMRHDQKNPTYDVINGRGQLIGRVELPESTSLFGFGAPGTVYVIRTDADDLQYLQRYRIGGAAGEQH